MTPEDYGREISRRITAGMLAGRSAVTAPPPAAGARGVTVTIDVHGSALMSDDDIRVLVRKIGRRLLGGDGDAGSAVLAPRPPKPLAPAAYRAV